MAAVAPPADQAADLLKNLSIDSQSKTFEIPEPTKKISVDTIFATNGQNQIPVTPDFMDPTVAYFPNGYPSSTYYYGGYDGTTNGYGDMSHGVYGDMYHGYGYTPYGPYSPSGSPLPTVTHDGQLYGSQQFQYPNPYFQSMTPTSGPTHPKGENAPSGPLTMDSTNGFKSTTHSVPVKPTPFNANGSYKRGSQNGFQDPKYGYNGVYSPIPYLDFPLYPNEQAKKNSNITLVSNMNNVASRPMNQMYGNKLYNQYGRDYQSFYAYGANAYNNFQSNYKLRGRGNGFFYNNENGDGLNELNRGPRTTRSTLAVKGQHVTSTVTDGVEKDLEVMENVDLTPNREQYNQPDFRDSYEDAKFFVIKSYSEDDVHKSIKYNVWASTQNGNKKLDAAYQEVQQKSGSCPVFLFFSVNTSGQFVGIAEMVGPVDFNKSLEYWQQDKWIGCFPVKWHIVKDVPNSLLKHIILEYNENKPVTNSRDTQEVKLEQGLEVLKIFKEESSKQCILDDFDFYEDRQKRIQEKKAKQQQFQKQLLEGKPKEELKVDVVPKEEVISVHMNGDVKLAEKQLQ